MESRFYPPSEAVWNAFHEGLEEFVGCTAISEEYAFPVYTIGLAAGARPEASIQALEKSAGWKFLAVEARTGEVYLTDVSLEDAGQLPEVLSVTRGEPGEKALRTLRNIQSRGECSAVEHEIRWLSIPGVLAESLWVKFADSKQTDADLVLPVLSLDRTIYEREVHVLDDFLELIRPLAEERIAIDDDPICGYKPPSTK